MYKWVTGWFGCGAYNTRWDNETIQANPTIILLEDSLLPASINSIRISGLIWFVRLKIRRVNRTPIKKFLCQTKNAQMKNPIKNPFLIIFTD